MPFAPFCFTFVPLRETAFYVVTEKTNKSSNFPAAMKQSLGLIALFIFVALITLVLAATQVSR
jgi:hypothetical protein